MPKTVYSPPHETEIVQEIKARAAKIPNCEIVQSAVLKPGPQTFKVASVLQFRNPTTCEVTHRELHLNDYPFRVHGGIKWEIKDRLKHWGCKDSEIEQLRIFLSTFDKAAKPGDYTVIEGKPTPSLEELLRAVAKLDSPNLAGVIVRWPNAPRSYRHYRHLERRTIDVWWPRPCGRHTEPTRWRISDNSSRRKPKKSDFRPFWIATGGCSAVNMSRRFPSDTGPMKRLST